ncbi:hypothetical protein QC761_0045140 [Podospora bellae-mahoneyi]|uniref:Uncharacterized protein n=1 Tax=Podospora bellae-mahoneyi TaxID=2093777 RepID=A0ABR0FRT5_9PEZI|nr:hypothetical protein QC761_0045140 [Podospora bellae-mahoneyi]
MAVSIKGMRIRAMCYLEPPSLSQPHVSFCASVKARPNKMERKGMGAALQTETLCKTLAVLTLRPCNGLSSARS